MLVVAVKSKSRNLLNRSIDLKPETRDEPDGTLDPLLLWDGEMTKSREKLKGQRCVE